MFRSLRLAALVSALAALPAAAEPALVEAGLRTGWQETGGTRVAALELRLAPGWKTYWRAPGEAGIPPRFDWTGSDNVAAVQVRWPAPHAFAQSGMTSIGYGGQVVLPLEIAVQDPARPVALRGRIEIGVCRDICVPVSLTVAADLDGRGAPDPAIANALARQPNPARAAGLSALACSIEPIADGLRLSARLVLPALGGDEVVAIEPGDATVWVSQPQVTRQGGTLTAVADLVSPRGAPFALNRRAITLTVIGADRAVEVQGCPAP